VGAASLRQQRARKPAKRKSATHCRLGHRFTRENTWWNTTKEVAPDGTRIRTRLCAKCSRKRLKRYRVKHPQPQRNSPPLPRLPGDCDELLLEATIRRVLRARKAERAPTVWQEVGKRLNVVQQPGSASPVVVPVLYRARPGELWTDYGIRLGVPYWDDGVPYGEWLASRLLAEPRIRQVLERAACGWVFSVPGAGSDDEQRQPLAA
jgi:hypothetical protein